MIGIIATNLLYRYQIFYIDIKMKTITNIERIHMC